MATNQELMVIKEKTDKIKTQIKEMIEAQLFDNALTLLNQLKLIMPSDPEVFAMLSFVYTSIGDVASAKQSIEEPLKKNIHSLDLFYNLGFIYEQEKNYIDAYNMYRNALYLIKNQEEEKDIIEALSRVRVYITALYAFSEDEFKLKLTDTKKDVYINYLIGESLKRKQILLEVLKWLSPQTESVIELETESGIIARNLNEYGFDVVATDSEERSLLKWMGIEWQNQLRTLHLKNAKFYQYNLNLESVDALNPFDVILLFPWKSSWFSSVSKEELIRIFESLILKAKVQLFYYLPKDYVFHTEVVHKISEFCMSRGYYFNALNSDLITDFSLFIVSKEEPEERKNTVIPHGLEAVNSKSNILMVDVSKCRDLQASGYSQDSWHQFVATLLQYRENNELLYQDSVLKIFYNRFNPNSYQDRLFPSHIKPLPLISDGWINGPWEGNKKEKYLIQKENPETRPGGNHHYGPNTDEFGEREFKSIINIYKNMERWGYHPEIFPDGYINGYMLKNGNDYRFIITEGQHRMPAAALLSDGVITCKFSQSSTHPRIVDIKDIKNWPGVKHGVYSRSVAEKVFLRFFEDDGPRKAKEIGLL